MSASPKEKIRKILQSLPAAIPYAGHAYSHYFTENELAEIKVAICALTESQHKELMLELGALTNRFVTLESFFNDSQSKSKESGANDSDILENLYACFDRYAFREPMCHEEHSSFIQAIKDTRVSIVTGVIRDSQHRVLKEVQGKAHIGNQIIRDKLDAIVDLLREIETNWDTAIFQSRLEIRGGGCISYDNELLDFVDCSRNRIIAIVNDIYCPMGKIPLPYIPKVEKRKRGYTTGHLARNGPVVHCPIKNNLLGFTSNNEFLGGKRFFGSSDDEAPS